MAPYLLEEPANVNIKQLRVDTNLKDGQIRLVSQSHVNGLLEDMELNPHTSLPPDHPARPEYASPSAQAT